MNILIADDDVTTRISLCMIAEKWGYSVTSASNGLEIFKLLERNDIIPPKLLILDWEMPGMDGIEVCRQLRTNPATSSVYIIMLTMRNQKRDLIDGLEAGADDYLTKPFSPDELKARLRTGERIVGLQEHLANQIFELKTTIHKLNRTEAALDETKDYRNLFKHANDSIIVFNPVNHVVLNVNDKACETYGFQREQFIGMSFREIAADFMIHEEMANTVVQLGKAEEFELTHLRADKKPINMLINSAFVKFNGYDAILSVNRDITDRREIEILIERALQEWSDTVDAVSDMIILTDGENKIRRCNEATARFFDSSYLDLIGKRLNQICRFSLSENVTAVRDAGPVDGHPLTVKSWEGQLAGHPSEWFEITNHRVSFSKRGDEGNEHWVHVFKNITARKRSEASLNLLKTAVEQAADSVVVTDKHGLIEYVNPAFLNCVGWSRDEVIGNEMLDLQARALRRSLRNDADRIGLPESVWQGVYHASRKSGEMYEEEISISPIRNEADGSIYNYVAVCRDVTEKRRLESIAEAVNMMQNVGYVFSGIRHELGNPINSVKTALTVLKKNLLKWETSQVNVYIERCLTETERVEYLLKALKTFSMYENPQMERLDLLSFMKNFISLIEGDFHDRGVDIKLNAKETIGEVLCDPRALHQVLLNLITNAVDAIQGTDEPLITIHLKKDKRLVRVTVEDNGCGMNDAQTDNLFKPFYTSKECGTGLGLVIVKKMVTKMNGTIWIESAFNEGTRVNFTLETAAKGTA